MATLHVEGVEGEGLEKVEEKFAKETATKKQITELGNWYRAQEKNLLDRNLKLEDLENNSLWNKAENSSEFDPEVFQRQTQAERELDLQENLLARGFKEKRKKAIEERKLDIKLNEILAKKVSVKEKLQGLTRDEHKELWKSHMAGN